MSQQTTTQLITVAATLAGVLLTFVANSYLDHRRAKDTRSLETLRLSSEHEKWLRDERLKSYADFFLAGEDVFHFLDSELPKIIQEDPQQENAAKIRWRDLSIQLRKTYNQVLLFGSDETRPLARELWRKAWYGGRAFFRDLADEDLARDDLSNRIRDIANSIGEIGNNLIEMCRREFQTRPDA